MRELFSERDFTRIGYYQTVLEAEGIQTFIRNENLSGTEVSIPIFFPALCVVDEHDYEKALQVLKTLNESDERLSRQETTCPKCGESNPGNFETCWSCSAVLRAAPGE
jgi:hypothetical protein